MFLTPMGPSNLIHCEVVRTATSMLCKETLQPGKGMDPLGLRETEKVEARLRALAGLERVREENTYGVSGSGNQPRFSAAKGDRNARVIAPGEETERRLFADTMRDGHVLCQ